MNLFGFEITRNRSASPAPASTPRPANAAARLAGMNRRSLLQAAQSTRLEASWSGTPETADALITKNLRTMVARSRNQSLEDGYAKHFVKLIRTNVVGHRGIGLRSTPRDFNGKIDFRAKDAIEGAWRVQSMLGNWEVTGQMSRAMFERLWIGGCAIDGEAIALIVQGPDAGPTGFGLQMMDPMRLDPMQNEVVEVGGNFIRHGIEFNRFGRPVAYHFLKDDPNIPLYASGYYGRDYERVPAERVIHAFIPEIVGQRRGIPWMSAVLWRMNMLKGFEDSAAVNARIGAAKMGFFSDPNGDLPEGEDLPMNADPGTFENIGSLQLHQFNPTFPDQAIEPFIRAELRGIASGLGVSYASLASDLSQSNFSSMREGKNAEQDEFKVLQEWMIDTLERRVFEAWIDRAVLAGSITINGNALRVANLEKYRAAEFKPRRWSWVDPLAEVSAAKMAVEAGLSSRTKYIEEWGEADAYEVFEEIAEEQKDMKSLGVQVVTTPGGGSTGGGNPEATKKPEA
jgi:lambda family phage portal protein